MKYRLLLSDIDGTLRPGMMPLIPSPNVEAIQTIQRFGIKFAIATGRARSAVPEELLNGLQPDYWICAAGAQVLDRDGGAIASSRMTLEQLDALTEFCTEKQYPLTFSFDDGIYAYTVYEQFRQRERALNSLLHIKNGEDGTRHLSDMPFSASAQLPPAAAEQFQTRYGSLGLQFIYYGGCICDILRPGQDKATGLSMLLQHTGLRAGECVSVGDGNNDVGILQASGLGFCVEDGVPAAAAAADRLCPPAGDCGVAAVCRMIWPEAFQETSG